MRKTNDDHRPHGRLFLQLLALCCLLLTACTKDPALEPEASPGGKLSTGAAQAQEVAALAAAQTHTSMLLFNGGNEGIYHSFRIPSIIRTNNGTLIAFAEGRKNGPGDYGDINLVYKRSTNHGVTWSALQEVVGVGPGTWGNPTAVYDAGKGANGRVWLFMCWNSGDKDEWSDFDSWGDRRVYVSYSDDHGLTWSAQQDMTSTLTPTNYTWDAVGPGIGIQTEFDHPGRLIIPAKGRNIYSDDHGTTWKYALIPGGTDEGTIVELLDGKLLRNDRPGTTIWETSKKRLRSVGSIEGGFPAWTADPALTDPKCEASIVRYNTPAPARIIFLNPNDPDQRCNMTVRISYDDGKTWPLSRAVFGWNTCDYPNITIAKGGYSSMIKTADYAVATLIEINENVHSSATSHKSIEFHKFNLPWILNGRTEP